MTEFIFIQILLIHFLADFAMQTNDQARNKSTSNVWLIRHVYVYSLIWFIAILPYGLLSAVTFFSITVSSHYLTDWCTSRINKIFFDKNDMHNGFVGIGFDQMLHYIQLYYTFKLILWMY